MNQAVTKQWIVPSLSDEWGSYDDRCASCHSKQMKWKTWQG